MLFPVMCEVSHHASCCPWPASHSLQLHAQIFRQGKLYKPQIRTFLCLTRTFSSQPLVLQTGPKSETLRKLASLPPLPTFSCQQKDFSFFHQEFTADIYSLKKKLLCH